MKKFIQILLTGVFLLVSFASNAQKGKDFWFAIPYATTNHPIQSSPYIYDRGGTPSYFRISCTGPTKVTISVPAREKEFTPIEIEFKGYNGAKDSSFSVEMSRFITTSQKWPALWPSGGPYIDDIQKFTPLNNGIYIHAFPNDITVYYDINNPTNRELFSLKDTLALGTEFFIPMQNKWKNKDPMDRAATPTAPARPATPEEADRCGFEIIATENETEVVVEPTAALFNGYPANVPFTIHLNKGQTYSVIAKGVADNSHLGGTRVTSNKKISIVTKDDSVLPNNGSHDFIGDQIIPVPYLGKEYIVMKSSFLYPTYDVAFITFVEDGTNLEYRDGTTTKTSIGNLAKTVLALPVTGNYLYIKSTNDKPFYVFQTSGTSKTILTNDAELGGALIPKIDGCTGSQVVNFTTIVGEEAVLNIMTYGETRNSIYYRGIGTPAPEVKINPADFIEVPGTGWWVLTKNNFKNLIAANASVYTKNPIGRFHLGFVGGTFNVGAKYGYFSNFEVNKTRLEVSRDNGNQNSTTMLQACYGDILYLQANGGFNYKWRAEKEMTPNKNDFEPISNIYISDAFSDHPYIFPPPGNYNYWVTFTTLCEGDVTLKVNVSIAPKVEANFDIDTANRCSPNTKVTFTNRSFGANEFYWYFNYKSNEQKKEDFKTTSLADVSNIYPLNDSTDQITDTVRLKAYNTNYKTCPSIKTKTVTIRPSIDAKFDFSKDKTTNCNPINVVFADTSTGIVKDVYWDFGDGNTSIDSALTHQFVNDTTVAKYYKVKLKVTSPLACWDTASTIIKVNPPVKALFTVDSTSACGEKKLFVYNKTRGADSIYIDFGDTHFNKTIAPLYTNDYSNYTNSINNYTVKLKAYNSLKDPAGVCYDVDSAKITIYPEVRINTVSISNSDICNPNKSFTGNLQYPLAADSITYRWFFGDNASSVSKIKSRTVTKDHTYDNAEINAVTYKPMFIASSKYCSDTLVLPDVNIAGKLKADFINNKASGCGILNDTLKDVSIGSINYRYWFLDSAEHVAQRNKPTPIFPFSNSSDTVQKHNFQLVIENMDGCRDTSSKDTVTVNPGVEASFTTGVYSSCAPVEKVKFTIDKSIGIIDRFIWNFGDGTSDTSVFINTKDHSFPNLSPNDSDYTVKLTAISKFGNCTAEMRDTIKVYKYVNVDFTKNKSAFCSGETVTLKNISSPGTKNFTWTWISSGETSSNKDNLWPPFENATDTIVPHIIHLKGDNGYPACAKEKYDTISIFPKVHAQFTKDPKDSVCSHTLVTFYASDTTKSTASNLSWDFGDKTTDTGSDVFHIFNNLTPVDTTFEIKLLATSKYGCKDSITSSVSVYPYVNVDFTKNKSAFCSGETVTLKNISSPGTTKFTWTWSNSLTSFAKDTVWSPFENDADTIITRTVILKGDNGYAACAKEKKDTISIFPKVQALFTKNSKDSVCSHTLVTFNASDTTKSTASNLSWDFGDNTSEIGTKVSHPFTNLSPDDTLFKVKLLAISKYGCKDSITSSVSVYPYVNVDFTIDKFNLCSGEKLGVTNISSSGTVNFIWTWGDGQPDSTIRDPKPRQYINPLRTKQSQVITLRGTNKWDKCKQVKKDTIDLHPAVIASFYEKNGNYENCNPLKDTLVNSTDAVAKKFRWFFSDGVTTNLADKVPHTFTNLGGSIAPHSVKLIANSDYCADTFEIKTFKVYPFVKADMSINSTKLCSGESLNVTNNSPSWLNHNWYTWDDGKSINDTIYTSLPLNHIYNNPGPDSVNRTITLKVLNDQGCPDSIKKVITVYPEVIAKIKLESASDSCTPLVVKFKNNHNKAATKFFWDYGDNSNSNEMGLVHPHTYNNTSPKDQPYRVYLRAESPQQCKSIDFIDVKAYSFVKANFNLADASICTYEYLNITNASLGGVHTKYWDFTGKGKFDSIVPEPIVKNYMNYGASDTIVNLKLKVRNEHFCYDSIIRPITIYPKVNADFHITSGKWTDCNPSYIQFEINDNNNASSFSWSFGDGSSSSLKRPKKHTFTNLEPNLKPFDVLLTASSVNCTAQVTQTVKVYPFIKADFTLNKSALCSGDSIEITENTPPGVTSRWWDFDGDNNYDNLGDTPIFKWPYFNKDTSKTRTDTLRLKVTNGNCYAYSKAPIKVFPRVIAKITTSADSICDGLSIMFRSNNSIGPITMYDWDFRNGTTSASPEKEVTYFHMEEKLKKYPVTLKVTTRDNCISDTTYNVYVHSYLNAEFKLQDDAICSGDSVLITDASEGGKGISTRIWNFGSGLPVEYNTTGTFSKKFPVSGNKLVTLTIKNIQLCESRISHNIMINPKPVPKFTYKASSCSPLVSTFDASGSSNTAIFNWKIENIGNFFGSKFTKSIPNYDTVDITRKVTLVAISANQCVDSLTKTITVYHNPQAFISSNKTEDCPPFIPVIQNTSKTSNATYHWYFGDGKDTLMLDRKGPLHEYGIDFAREEDQPYNLKLVVETNHHCKDSAKINISVFPKVTAKVDPVAPHCNPNLVTFSNNTLNADIYKWNFDDNGATSDIKPANHLFKNDKTENRTFNVELKAISHKGCRDSITIPVTIYPAPVASFLVYPREQRIVSKNRIETSTFTFIDSTNKGPWKYKWDMGNGEILNELQDSKYTYKKANKYTVSLYVENVEGNCKDSVSQDLVLLAPQPKALFGTLKDDCVPHTIIFSDESEDAEEYTWDFGDGSNSSKKEPMHTFVEPGEFNIKLHVKSEGGEDEYYRKVKVFPKPEAKFSVDPKIVMIPDDHIRCFNSSIGASQYFWDFGDGDTSDAYTPTHYYKNTNEIGYTVKLRVKSDQGCVDSMQLFNFVQVFGKGRIVFPNAFTPNMAGAAGRRYDVRATDNDIFYPYHEGVSEYHLEIYNRWGELLFSTDDVFEGWDGYYKGKLVKQDVYVYKAKGKFYNGKTFVKTGDLTLLHKDH